MGFIMQLSAVMCALLIGWSGQVGAVWTKVDVGNSEGAPCVFPFTYEGVQYDACTRKNWDDLWCATTNSFDADGVWGACTSTPPAGVQANAPLEVYTKAGKKCVFPFTAFGKTFKNCTTEFVTVKDPWCATTADYDKDRLMGYCDFSRSSACGDFDKMENKFAYDGIENFGAATLADCKKICLDNSTCLGFDFNSRNKCYLHFDEKAFNDIFTGTGVDHYIRQVCTTTAAPTTAVMSTPSDGNGTCEDSFEFMNNTLTYGGEQFASARSVNACMDACLTHNNETGKYCFAFDYNDQAQVWCYLHFVAGDEAFLATVKGVLHYKRIKCIPPAPANTTTSPECEDGFNKTENRLSYEGKRMPLLTSVEDCKTGCLANESCLAFDYDNKAKDDLKCFHHLDAGYVTRTNPDADGVDQYVRVKIPCPEGTTMVVTTESTVPPTTKPQKTTRRPVTTKKPACVDTYTEVKNQHSFDGKLMPNVSTVDGCKEACSKMADCVGTDYDNKMKECFAHNEATFKTIAPATGVTQYVKVKCVVPTTTVVLSTTKPPTGKPTPICVKEFVKSAGKHAFNGERKLEAKTVVDCKQLCLATDGCAGLDFDMGDNSCWLHTAKNIDGLAGANDVDNYKLTENCNATTPAATTATIKTTVKPVCKDTFSEMNKKHGFGATPCPSAKTLDDCKKACIANTSCVAIDFVDEKSECWVHMPENGGPIVIAAIEGINHYPLVRCAREPTEIVTTPTISTTTECEESFTEFPNKHAYSGVEIAIADTLEKCKDACRGNAKCVAIDFNVANKVCWIHVDAKKAEALAELPGVNHYKLERRCGSTAPTTTIMPAECVADIAMVVDSSGSIRDANVAGRKDNYDLIKEFLSMMVGRMRIGPQETRVAAVTFSNYAQMRFPLNKYNSLEPLQTALVDLPYAGGRTNTTGALRLTRTKVFTQANGDRPKVKNIIVLITDGNTTLEASKLSDEISRVKDAGITVFGIGVTEGINKNELKSLVSEPVSTHFFTVDDFNQLIGVLENVILGTCAQQTTPSARK